jgi:hypothetical protein
MNKALENLPNMTFKRDGKIHNPLFITQVNGRFIIGVYQGTLSKFDILNISNL